MPAKIVIMLTAMATRAALTATSHFQSYAIYLPASLLKPARYSKPDFIAASSMWDKDVYRLV